LVLSNLGVIDQLLSLRLINRQLLIHYKHVFFIRKGLRRHQDAKLVGNRARVGVVRVLANPNV